MIAMLLESYRDAKKANQHGPAIRAVELLGKSLGVFKDRIGITEESAMSDEQLIKSFAGDDAVLEAALWRKLGAPDTFDA